MNECAVEPFVQFVDVTPANRMSAVQWPEGGLAQDRVAAMLKPLVTVELWDGVVQSLKPDQPAFADGSRFQWKSVHLKGVYRSAQVGEWIVVTLGTDGRAHATTHSEDDFNTLYTKGTDRD